jgi:hypothetical protein
MRALALFVFCAATINCLSQGAVNFANGAAGVDAPFRDANGVLLSGNAYLAQLYVGPAGSPASGLATNGVRGTPAAFGTGPSAGYFLGGARMIDGYAPGTLVTLQVRMWATASGSSWESAVNRGESNPIQISLGGGTIPTPNMIGLMGSPVPEPSSYVLGAIGLLVGIIFRKRSSTR